MTKYDILSCDMVAGPQQQSRTFDPVAAGATLRRDRVAKIRATTTVETTLETRQPMGGQSFQRSPLPKTNDPVRREDYDRANAPKPDRLAGSPADWKPMGGQSFQQSPFPKTNDPVRKEDYDRANASKPGTQSRLDGNPDSWKPMGGNGFKGSPLPQQLSGPDSNLPVRSQEQDSANAQDPSSKLFADQQAARRQDALKQRAANRAKSKSSEGDTGEKLTKTGVSWLYSLLFQGGGAIGESAPVDGGFTGTSASMGSLYQTILTIFPAFNDKMNDSFIGEWLPQKFDLKNDSGLSPLEHFGEWCKGIMAWTEILLYILTINLVIIIFFIAAAVVMNPSAALSTIISFL